jgi:flagellar biosynthesis GTPase FlhF
MKNQSFKNPLNSVLTQLIKTVFGFLNATLRPSIIRKKNKILEEKKLKKGESNNDINNNEIIEVKENNIPRNLFSEENEEEKNNNKELNENIENIENNNNENENKNNESNKEIEEKNDEENNTKINEIITVLPEEIDLTEYEDTDIYSCSYYLFNSVCDLIEGKKNPIIYVTLYSKSVGMELLTLMLTITQDLFIYLPNFISRIKDNIIQSLTKNFNSAYDYITCVKLSRFVSFLN